ncbi:MAG TPA: DNA-processing protein DprA [Frankiaceae bacterium]|nr:DNA-processing protein DprA [Frankiaceae bacterium]
MTSHDEHAALVVLLRRARSWSELTDLVEERGSATAVLEEMGGTLFDPRRDDDLAAARRDLAGWRATGLEFFSVLDEGYPRRLRTVHQRPPFVMVRGRLTEADERAVAVVGTRRPSPDGLADTARLTTSLVERRWTIVSGLAAGIDAAAHRAAVGSEGRTLAVVGTGLRRVYPADHGELQEQIVHNGAVLSQFWPDAPPTKSSFPMRNAVMSGLRSQRWWWRPASAVVRGSRPGSPCSTAVTCSCTNDSSPRVGHVSSAAGRARPSSPARTTSWTGWPGWPRRATSSPSGSGAHGARGLGRVRGRSAARTRPRTRGVCHLPIRRRPEVPALLALRWEAGEDGRVRTSGQATVRTWSPETGDGTALRDDGSELALPAVAFAAGGLRALRPGQRVRVELEGDRVVLVTVATLAPP